MPDMVDRKEMLLCSLPVCSLPKESHLYRTPTLTSLLMLILPTICQGITVIEGSDISLFHMISQQCSVVIWPVNQTVVSLKHTFQRFLLHKRETRKCQSFEKALAIIWRASSQLPHSSICLPPILTCHCGALASRRRVSCPSPHSTAQVGPQALADSTQWLRKTCRTSCALLAKCKTSGHSFFSVSPKCIPGALPQLLSALVNMCLFPALRVASSKLQWKWS